MTTPARAAAIDAAIGSSSMGRFAANGNAAGDSSAIRSRPVVRFWEGCEEGGYTSTHLSSAPMSLGWYDGYTQEVLSANLARPGLSEFWRSWDNCTGLACDRNLFEDIKEKISFGLLYCERRISHLPFRDLLTRACLRQGRTTRQALCIRSPPALHSPCRRC